MRLERYQTKDLDFRLGVGENINGERTWSYDAIIAALLMDLRDQLRHLNDQINATLRCSAFLAVPRTLRQIRANTARPRPSKKLCGILTITRTGRHVCKRPAGHDGAHSHYAQRKRRTA